jgi:hypothetical protein
LEALEGLEAFLPEACKHWFLAGETIGKVDERGLFRPVCDRMKQSEQDIQASNLPAPANSPTKISTRETK